MTEQWTADEKVLRSVVQLYEGTGAPVRLEAVLEACRDSDGQDVRQSLRRLSDHGYIEARGSMQERVMIVMAVTERGLRAVQFWPDDAEHLADRLMQELARAVDVETEPARKSRLQRGLSGLGFMGRDLLVEVSAAAITRSIGMS
jgi:hypothetical protein